MAWDINILKSEGEIMKKLHAFRLFKEHGLEAAAGTFPKLISFLQENSNKSIEEFESEQMLLLEQIYEISEVGSFA